MNFDKELDARGLSCPLPILKTKKSLNELASGQVLKVVATDPGSIKEIERAILASDVGLTPMSDGKVIRLCAMVTEGVAAASHSIENSTPPPISASGVVQRSCPL